MIIREELLQRVDLKEVNERLEKVECGQNALYRFLKLSKDQLITKNKHMYHK